MFGCSVVVLHRVSIRTLGEPSWLCVGWGQKESRCCHLSVGLVKAQRDTQSSGHGVVATGNMICFLRPLLLERHVRLLGDPDAMKQYGQLAGYGDDGPIPGLLATSRGQAQTPLS